MSRVPPCARACALLCCVLVGCAAQQAEGRDWVRDIEFHGNHHFSDKVLLDHLAVEETSWLPFAKKRYLDPLVLEVDRRRVVAFYRAHGYFSARLVDVEVKPADEGSVNLVFTVDEGPPTRVQRMAIDGLDVLPAKVARPVGSKLPLAQGQVYEEQKYLDTKVALEVRLAQRGYAWVKASGHVLVDRERQTAQVALQVEPGPVVHYGRVLVEGSPLGEAIRRRATIRPGARYDPADLEETRQRLVALGQWSTIAVSLVRRQDDPSVADVAIRLRSGARNDFKVGIGVGFESDRQSIRLPISYARYGFLGGLRTLRLRAQPGYVWLPNIIHPQSNGPALLFDATLDQPDVLLRNLGLRFTVGYDLGVDYGFKFHGPRGQVGLQYSLLRGRLQLGASYNFQFLFFFQVADANVFQNPDEAKEFLGFTNPYRLAYLEEHASIDLTDNTNDPHRGLYFTLSTEEGTTFLGSSFRYEKLTPDLRFFIPLGPRVTLAQRVLYGRLFERGGQTSPITRRYYAGGSDSHRGFGFDRLAPQVESESGVLIPVGGNLMFLSQSDLVVRVLRFRGGWVGVNGFFDAGDVPGPGYGIDFKQLHLATGLGLRYSTPIGVLRFDVGARLNRLSPFQPDGRQNPDPGKRFAYHLSVGGVF